MVACNPPAQSADRQRPGGAQTAILGGQNATLRGLGSVPHQARNRSELAQPFLFVAVLTTMTSSRR